MGRNIDNRRWWFVLICHCRQCDRTDAQYDKRGSPIRTVAMVVMVVMTAMPPAPSVGQGIAADSGNQQDRQQGFDHCSHGVLVFFKYPNNDPSGSLLTTIL